MTKKIVPESWKIEEMIIGENVLYIWYFLKTAKDEKKFIIQIPINAKKGSLGNPQQI